MSRAEATTPEWRKSVDLDLVELALMELRPLLNAVAATGAAMLIKSDGGRVEGASPPLFTVVISAGTSGASPIRFDDSDLIRAVVGAITEFDARR